MVLVVEAVGQAKQGEVKGRVAVVVVRVHDDPWRNELFRKNSILPSNTKLFPMSPFIIFDSLDVYNIIDGIILLTP